MERKTSLTRFCEIVQTGTIAGLAAIPFIADVFHYKPTPRLHAASLVLALFALLSSLWIARTASRERGFWGAILTVAFLLWAWGTPVIL